MKMNKDFNNVDIWVIPAISVISATATSFLVATVLLHSHSAEIQHAHLKNNPHLACSTLFDCPYFVITKSYKLESILLHLKKL